MTSLTSSQLIDLTYIAERDGEDARINASLTGQFDFSKIKSISVSKIDCNFNNTLPCFVVPLKTPYTSPVDPDKGFETIYNIYLYHIVNGNIQIEQSSVYWKNDAYNTSEVQFDGKDYNNFHDYFRLYKFKPILDSVNKLIKDLFKQYVLNGAVDDAVNILPAFDATNDTLKLYSPLDDNSIRFHNRFNPTKLRTEQPNDYCFGFSQEFARDFCRAFNLMKQPYNNEPIYFIDEIPTYSALNSIEIGKPGEPGKTETYYIYSLSDPHFYEYTNFIQGLVLTSSQIPTCPMFINCNTGNGYKLIQNSNQVDNSFNALIKLNINHSQEQTSRLIYSNANILGNGIKILGNTNVSTFSVSLYTFDKYMNLKPLRLNKFDTINISLTFNY